MKEDMRKLKEKEKMKGKMQRTVSKEEGKPESEHREDKVELEKKESGEGKELQRPGVKRHESEIERMKRFFLWPVQQENGQQRS